MTSLYSWLFYFEGGRGESNEEDSKKRSFLHVEEGIWKPEGFHKRSVASSETPFRVPVTRSVKNKANPSLILFTQSGELNSTVRLPLTVFSVSIEFIRVASFCQKQKIFDKNYMGKKIKFFISIALLITIILLWFFGVGLWALNILMILFIMLLLTNISGERRNTVKIMIDAEKISFTDDKQLTVERNKLKEIKANTDYSSVTIGPVGRGAITWGFKRVAFWFYLTDGSDKMYVSKNIQEAQQIRRQLEDFRYPAVQYFAEVIADVQIPLPSRRLPSNPLFILIAVIFITAIIAVAAITVLMVINQKLLIELLNKIGLAH